MKTIDEVIAIHRNIAEREEREKTVGLLGRSAHDETAQYYNQIADWLTDYKRMKAIENPEEIGMLKLQVQNWLGGMEISLSVMESKECRDASDLMEQIELLKTVVAVLERIKA